ncbi:MAG: PAS domain-containing protein [Candidatus Riflebacteria bacterium]|nr:PAS domain-containing protein [Candidatus Riflebacteria bacterium]
MDGKKKRSGPSGASPSRSAGVQSPAIVRKLQGEIRRLSQRLRETQALLEERESILDRLPTLITLMDSRLRFIWVNQAYADWYRLPRKNIIGRRVQDIIAPASFDAAERFMRSALEGQACSFENIAFGADGKVRGVRASYFPLSDATGKITHFVAVVEDVTAQKQAEQQRDQGRADLQTAHAQIKALRGVIPICAKCKKVRTDQGYWQILEAFIREHSEADFTHGLCPDCARHLYPTLKCTRKPQEGGEEG